MANFTDLSRLQAQQTSRPVVAVHPGADAVQGVSRTVTSVALAAMAPAAAIPGSMPQTTPLLDNSTAPCLPPLPSADQENPHNLIQLYERLPIPGKPSFSDTTPSEQASAIWAWMHGPGLRAVSEFDGVLDLREAGLTALPQVIGLFQNMSGLPLYRNQLKALPPEIGRLTGLLELICFDNQLTQLPPEIGLLTRLTMLDFSSNRLTHLPPAIGELKNLQELRLYSNLLSQLPPEIGGLRSLSIFALQHNCLTQLPREIGALQRLDKLELYHNKLGQLPPEIGQLTSLRTLSLFNNPITLLAPDVRRQLTEELQRQLPELRHIDLYSPPRHPPEETKRPLEEGKQSGSWIGLKCLRRRKN